MSNAIELDLRTPRARAALRELFSLRSKGDGTNVEVTDIMDVWVATAILAGRNEVRMYGSYNRWGERQVRYFAFPDQERLMTALLAHLQPT